MNQSHIPPNDSRQRKRGVSSSAPQPSSAISSANLASDIASSASATDANISLLQSISALDGTRAYSSFPQSFATGLQHAKFSIDPVAPLTALAPHATPDIADPWGLYGGNIAAACEAANEELVRKRSEGEVEDEDEERKRHKASSRLTAWQSRERKRIEMEVLQERQTQLTQRNGDLRNENDQLRLIIQRLKSIVMASSTQQQLALAAFGLHQIPGPSAGATGLMGRNHSTEGGEEGAVESYGTLGNISGPSAPQLFGLRGHAQPLSMQFPQQPQQSHFPLHLQDANPSSNLFPYPSGVSPQDLPILQQHAAFFPLYQYQQQQQQQQYHPPQQQQPQQQLLQQSNVGTFSAAPGGIPMNALLGMNDFVLPRTHHHTLEPNDRPEEQNRQTSALDGSSTRTDTTLHHQGISFPFDLSSLLAPPQDVEVNVPLLRAFSKRRNPDDDAKQGIGGSDRGKKTQAP